MSASENNFKHLRRVCFVDEADYNLFRNHLIEPLLNNIDDLQTFLENVVIENIKASADTTSLNISFYKKMDKQIQKHIIYKKIYDSYLPFTHPHEFLILILKQLFKIIHFDEKSTACDSVEESSLINESVLIVIRFVNGLLDYFQKYKYAQSLVKLGESVNLPPWIVELRHSGTHERRLPNMGLVKKGLYFSLHYLLTKFWTQRSSIVSPPGSRSIEEQPIEQTVQQTTDLRVKKPQPTDFVLINNKRRANESVDELHKAEALEIWEGYYAEVNRHKHFGKLLAQRINELKRPHKQYSGFEVASVPPNLQNANKQLTVFLSDLTEQWKNMYDYEKQAVMRTHYDMIVGSSGSRSLTHYLCLTLYKFSFYFLQESAKHPQFNLSIRLVSLKKIMENFESSVVEFDIKTLRKIIAEIATFIPYKDIKFKLMKVVKKRVDQAKKDEKSNLDSNSTENTISTVNTRRTIASRDFSNMRNTQNYKFETLPDWKPKPFGVL